MSSDGQGGGWALLWMPKSEVEVKGLSRWYIDAYIYCDKADENYMT